MRIHLAPAALLGVLFFLSTSQAETIRGKVSRLADGDTLTMIPATGEKPIKVRMVGMDTAELHFQAPGGQMMSQGPWAERGAKRLAELAPIGATVTLEHWGAESFGRALGQVHDKHGQDINLQLVEEGLAAAYVICTGETCKPGFLEAQNVRGYMEACQRAVDAERGIFNPKDPLKEMPFEFRARVGKTKPYRPVGDLVTGELLPAAEYKKVPLCQRIFFGNSEDAERMGFRAAR